VPTAWTAPDEADDAPDEQRSFAAEPKLVKGFGRAMHPPQHRLPTPLLQRPLRR
jgi:hypothetical protein